MRVSTECSTGSFYCPFSRHIGDIKEKILKGEERE